jgi:solute carrier family 35, member F1/2
MIGSKCSARTRRTLLAVLFGQLLSLFVSACGVSSTLLATTHGVNVPTFQSVANYAVLALFTLTSAAPVRRVAERLFRDTAHQRQAAETRGAFWRRAFVAYLPLALVDVEANFAVVAAFQYTDLASVMLLDCWAIPCVMLLSRFLLGHRFTWRHVVGAAVCVSGIVVLVIADWIESGVAAGAANALLGDALVLVGATLYAISNTGVEHMVSHRPRMECMGFIGLFGSLFGGLQAFALERHRVAAIAWSGEIVALFVVFGVFQLLQYLLTPTMFRLAGATMFNLSLLTSDTFSVIIAVVAFGRRFTVQYAISAALILIGIAVYQTAPEPKRGDSSTELEVDDVELTSTGGGDVRLEET